MIIYTESDEPDGGRYRWTAVPVSAVGVQLNTEPPEDANAVCLLCKAHATARSLFHFTHEGREKMAVMHSCSTHTGQWEMEELDQGYLWRNDG